jgi:TnpA family transposase
LKHRRLYSFSKPSAYPALEPMIAGRINVDLIRAHWSEILRVAASIRTGTVMASLIMRQLASYPRQNGVAAIILWNTRYLERTVATLRKAEDVPDQLLAHLFPLSWEHVNLTGDYVWGNQQGASENADGLRPLRAMPELTRQAA